ncbi:TonB-dependent receptor [Myroides marinus]|uniref:TonB-dependent receptor n=1 Tax=Myroides marinus TaxID=703342 RepID=UPI002575FFC2|nr:TonB-dependent receptor [Myroides marinus]MDM1353765.1 TonB-dependent siderophore receptor [Myroides marinus]
MKTYLYKSGIIAASLLLPYLTIAQTSQRVFGRLVGEKNNPIAYATVSIGNQIEQTDAKGEFATIDQVQFPLVLQINAMGYKSKQIALTEESYKAGFVIKLEEDASQLDEIVVTSRRNNSYLTNSTVLGGKYNGRIKDLPQSISIVSSELMEDKQVFQVADVIPDLAGVTQASVYDEFVIRGFKSGYDNGIRLINGMRSAYGFGESYYRSPMTINFESIEVLKGPGASLFGDIAPGGTINMVTKKPLENHRGLVNFSAGSFETLRTTVDVGGPIDKDKKILYRLNAGYESSKTFRDINNRKNFAVAPSFTFKPIEGTTFDVDLVFDQFNGYLDRGMSTKGGNLYALPRTFTLSQPSDYFKTKTTTLSGRLTQRITDNLNLHVNYMKSIYEEDLNEHRTLNTYANPPQNTIVNLRFFDRHGKEYTDNFVSYLKWDKYGKNIDHHIVVGVDYAQYKGDKNSYQREARSKKENGEVVPLTFDMNNPVYQGADINNYVWRSNTQYPFMSPYKSTGIYVQDQISVGERLKMVLGLRHESYKSESTDAKTPFTATQNVWLPRVGLTYLINDKINYFASYSQGYVPVSANFVANYKDYGADSAFKSEKSFQVETGLKTGFLDNQLQMDLSLFRIERRDMLIGTGQLTEAGLPVYRQSGRVISQGVELDMRGQITKEFQIMASYTYNDTQVKESAIASEEGQLLPGAPKNSASVWLKYVFSDTALKGLGFGAGVYYVDQRRLSESVGKDAQGNAQWGYLPAYTTANAALYYHLDKFKLSVNVNNIFDKYYFLGGFDYTRVFAGAPRNVMVSLGYNF